MSRPTAYLRGDLTGITDSLGRSTTKFLDAVGRLVSRTDPSGARYEYVYDPLNRVVQLTDPLGGQIVPSYDANGNLTTLTDARSNTTSYTYTSMDDRASRTDPLMRTEHFEYDLNRNVVRFTDRRGTGLRIPLRCSQPACLRGVWRIGSNHTRARSPTHTTPANRLTQAVDSSSGTITFEYDDLDRLTAATTPQGERRLHLRQRWPADQSDGVGTAHRLLHLRRGGAARHHQQRWYHGEPGIRRCQSAHLNRPPERHRRQLRLRRGEPAHEHHLRAGGQAPGRSHLRLRRCRQSTRHGRELGARQVCRRPWTLPSTMRRTN